MGEPDYEAGMKVRREVLGDDHVDRANLQTNDLDRDFQRWITETAWGGVWTREHLDRRTKSLVTIAILAALGHDELSLHLQAARNTGASEKDIAEVFFHVGVYAGVPQANRAFKMAKKLYGDRNTPPPSAEAVPPQPGGNGDD
jgi:4-carboxymuconolactone decarboxylase